MTEQQKKAFLSFQQGELDAVLMYRKLAELTDDSEMKEAFLEAAKDEGRHAVICRKYTEEDLKASDGLANIISKAYKFMPRALLLRGVAIGEYKGGDSYRPYIADFPELERIMFDEYRHGDKMKSLAKRSKK